MISLFLVHILLSILEANSYIFSPFFIFLWTKLALLQPKSQMQLEKSLAVFLCRFVWSCIISTYYVLVPLLLLVKKKKKEIIINLSPSLFTQLWAFQQFYSKKKYIISRSSSRFDVGTQYYSRSRMKLAGDLTCVPNTKDCLLET